MKLEDKIKEKAILEKTQILSDASVKANEVYNQIILEKKSEIEQNLEKAKLKYSTLKSQKELEARNELRDEVAVIKQKLVEKVFMDLKNELQNMTDADLFNYVVNGIKQEEINGDEVIEVSKKDYPKYVKILSTKSGDLVDCDLLNKRLGNHYNLKLSNKPAMIKNGFMLMGTTFDLNFSIEETLEKLAKKYEKIIYEELN